LTPTAPNEGGMVPGLRTAVRQEAGRWVWLPGGTAGGRQVTGIGEATPKRIAARRSPTETNHRNARVPRARCDRRITDLPPEEGDYAHRAP
jgi:hypothetical protein